MQRYIIMSVITVISVLTVNAKNDYDRILQPLDEAIAHQDEYVAKKRLRIVMLRKQFQQTSALPERLRAAFRLYEEYKPYINDSAIYYLRKCAGYAKTMKLPSRVAEYQAMIAFRCSATGMYDESQRILATINPKVIDNKALGVYYDAQRNIYGELAYYCHIDSMLGVYRQRNRFYEDKMLAVKSPNDDAVFLAREIRLRDSRRLKESMAVNTEWMRTAEKGSHRYALIAFYRYQEYEALVDTSGMIQWITESALSDVRNGVMDQAALWELANLLVPLGDIDHAYNYISYTSACAIKFGSRQRSWQMTPLLAEIARNYKELNEERTRQLQWTLTIISFLALLSLLLLYHVNKQRKKLALARRTLSVRNSQLSESNRKMKEANEQLSSLNNQMSLVNGKLAESNKVKDEYLGRFMRICSINIDKQDSFRKQVNRLLKNHEYDVIYKITSPSEFKDKELGEFYEQFDKAFLHLFPNFVTDFNVLLRPEEQISLTENGNMTTTLRIFALIRLGINDSSKIADFLHYSVNTIYNYRTRTKNAAAGNRDEFEQSVRKIGMQ